MKYSTVQYITVHYITLHDIALHYITLHYITLHYITLRYVTLHCIALHYIALHCITLHYITLPYVTLPYAPLHYIALHYINTYIIHTYLPPDSIYIYTCIHKYMRCQLQFQRIDLHAAWPSKSVHEPWLLCIASSDESASGGVLRARWDTSWALIGAVTFGGTPYTPQCTSIKGHMVSIRWYLGSLNG